MSIPNCPLCGAKPKILKVEGEKKIVCSNNSIHISCGNWFSSIEDAERDWTRRCQGYGQPEYYHPTNEEHLHAMLACAKGIDFAHILNNLNDRMPSGLSDADLSNWLQLRYVPVKCIGCHRNQESYCICPVQCRKE